MNQFVTVLLLAILNFMFSCSSDNSSKLSKEGNNRTGKSTNTNLESNKQYTINPKDLLKDFTTWYTYAYYNTRLSQDFVGLDVDSSIIKKGDFLNLLSTGNFVPIKTTVQNNLPFYKLYRFSNLSLDIQRTIKQMALTEIEHSKMEGKELPDYNFTDLNRQTYSKSSTKGKIIVLKCWFIHCVACVKEFPELNKLVEEYKNRNDMQFVSLAMDSKDELTLFLKTKEFKYAVVPQQKKFMFEKLKIMSYPTHILIGKDGKIVKVVNSIDELIPFVRKQI